MKNLDLRSALKATTTLHGALVSSLTVSAMIMALPGAAAAQTAATPATSTDASKAAAQPVEVIVTGTKIKRVDAETASPVQVVSKADIERSGYTDINSVLQAVSANGAGTLSANNSEAFAGGASGVALRGLSVGATLTLVDGHRLAPYPLSDDGERQFTDTQSIPFDAVDHVEVLKDGASAIYGSDAIAGVVNIILKKSITGFHATADEGTSQHGGGTEKHLAFSGGWGDVDLDGYNFYVSGEYRGQDAIYLRDRQYEQSTNLDFSPYGGNDMRPGANNLFANGTPATLTPYYLNPNGDPSSASSYQFLGTGCNYTKMAADQCTYTSPQKILSPTQKADFLASLTKKFNEDWQLNVKASVFDSRAQQSNAGYAAFPGASFAGYISNPIGGTPQLNVGSIADYSIPAGVAGNTTGAAADLYGVIPDLGLQTIDTDSKTYRLVADLDGKIGTWDVGASAGLTKVDTHVELINFVNYDNLYTALTSTTNPFNPAGGNSAATMNFIAPASGYKATDTLNYVDLHTSGTLFQLPGGPLGLAAGVGVTQKSLNNPGDPAVLAGAVGGTFSTYAIGKQNDTDAYLELDGKVIKSLELNAAVRYDDYNTYGSSVTPKFGFKWRPNDVFALRGTFANGFRAPSPAEVGTSATLFGLGIDFPDPILCGTDGGAAKGQVPASCSTAPGFIQTTNALKPETSKSATLGVIFEPIKGWSSTLDYYNIKIDNQIITAAELSNYTLANCLRGAALPQSGVSNGDGTTGTGTPIAGPITLCYSGYVNADKTSTSGLDFETHDSWHVWGGRLAASFEMSYELTYNLTANGETFKLAGTHGPSGVSGDTGNPRDREQFELSYSKGPWSVAAEGYRIGSYNMTDPSALLGADDTCMSTLEATYDFYGAASIPNQFCHTKAFTDVNLTGTYKFSPQLTMKLVVDNLFDAKAPVDAATYGGSFTPFNPSLHEDGLIGRFFNIGFSYDF